MSDEDRIRWDERYANRGSAPVESMGLPSVFVPFEDTFPTEGYALDVACGSGAAGVWLARRGMDVWGVDVSAVAVDQARNLAQRNGVGDRCRFEIADLDDGLPTGSSVDVILCHRFRDRRLDDAIIRRLAPGGLLAVTALSEVGADPGCFRVAPGELTAAFAGLTVIAAGEGQGEAWLLAQR